MLQSKPQKIKRKKIDVTVSGQHLAQPLQHEETEVLNVLEVHNVPSKADHEVLQMYFESPKSGGCDGAVEECSISHGTAYIKFHDPEGKLCNSYTL